MTHPWFAPAGRPRLLAHRGLVPRDDVGVVVENSLAAVAAADAVGAVYVESDCHLTRDGEVVLFHDDDLSRITGDPRPVADVTVEQLARLMADRGGLLTLAQALEAFPQTRFNLDVKSDRVAVAVGRLVADASDRVLLTSFSDARRRRALDAARRRGGEPATSAGTGVMTRALASLWSPRVLARVLDGVDALQIPRRHKGVRVLSRRLLDGAHRAGVEVHVWTIDDLAEMTALVAVGVDGIVTDRVDDAVLHFGSGTA